MNITQKINNKARKALKTLPSFQEMEREIQMNLNMIHGFGSTLSREGYKKVMAYNEELQGELRAHFDIDSAEYCIQRGQPF